MASKPNDYLAKAAACEEHAEHVRNAEIRALFEGIARQWREVANYPRDDSYLDLIKTEKHLTRRSRQSGR